MARPWKLIFLLAGIFAAGVVTGGFVTVRFGRALLPKPAGPDRWSKSRFDKLTERLGLTPEQQEKLRPVVQRDTEELKRIRNSSINETRRVIDQMNRDIAAVLTPEQRTKFDQMNRDLRERMQRLMKERGWGGGGSPPHGPPPDEPLPDKPPGG